MLKNGIVLMSTVQTDGRLTLWSLDNGSFTDLEALTGVKPQLALVTCRD